MLVKEATAEYSRKYPREYFHQLHTGETVSRYGFGSYRTSIGNQENEQALRKALTSGINLIDTAANYAFGDSEILIGSVIEDLINEGKLAPNEIVIITKAGYIEGEMLREAKRGELEGRRIPGLVKIDDNIWHSIHPFFLAEQLSQSLDRLNLLHVNALLLHNPEYYLMWAQAVGVELEAAREEFYRRVRRAFEYCEKAVADAKISWYGISSNSFGFPAEHQQFCSLEECVRIAEDIADKDHHFRFAQLPFNLLETGAATNKNQCDNSLTFLEYANMNGISVLANRPLNALSGGVQLVKLTTKSMINNAPSKDKIDLLIRDAINSESRFFSEIMPELGLLQDDAHKLRAWLTAGRGTLLIWSSLQSLAEWETAINEQFGARAMDAIKFLDKIDNELAKRWLQNYIEVLQAMWNAIGAHLADSVAIPSKIRRAATEAFGDEYGDLPFTRLALQSVASTQGVSCVLTGARAVEYVDEALLAAASETRPLAYENWIKYIEEISKNAR